MAATAAARTTKRAMQLSVERQHGTGTERPIKSAERTLDATRLHLVALALLAVLTRHLVALDRGPGGALASARVLADFGVRWAGEVAIDGRLVLPLRVGDVLTGCVQALEQLLGQAAGLADHQRRAFFLPDPLGLGHLLRVYAHVDQSSDRHRHPPRRYVRIVALLLLLWAA